MTVADVCTVTNKMDYCLVGVAVRITADSPAVLAQILHLFPQYLKQNDEILV